MARGVLLGRRLQQLYAPNLRGYSFINSEADDYYGEWATDVSNERKAWLDELFTDWKNDGVLEEFDRAFLIGPTTEATLTDLAHPSGTKAAIVNAVVFTADRHVQGDGVSARIRTNYTPSTDAVNLTLNAGSIGVWTVNVNTAVTVNDIGNAVAPRCSLSSRLVGDQAQCRVNGSDPLSLNSHTDSRHMYQAQRRTAADVRMFIDGAAATNSSWASTSLPTQEQWWLGANSTLFSIRYSVFAFWGGPMIGKEAALYTPLHTYLQRIGAVA